MATESGGWVSAAVEGMTDEAMAHRLVHACGGRGARVHVKGGAGPLLNRLRGYNQAALHSPWLVLTDLDKSFPCAGDLVRTWLPGPSAGMCLRVAVRSIEAWVLADRVACARFLGVAQKRIAPEPESLLDPKGFIVDLARSSTKRDIRLGLVPPLRSGRRVGPVYASELAGFIAELWDPHRAADRSPSLARCLNRLGGLLA